MMRFLTLCAACALAAPVLAQKDSIVRDGEYRFLEAQFGEQWAKQDAAIDSRLAEIRKANGGQPPNILYILIDDVSFGQMGSRTLNYVTGVDTPNINDLATEGLSMMRMYTEPSCTPTRTAMLTGRHPIRAGVKEVKVALVGEGLSAQEVTIAEVLKKVGYNTAHIGKWHQGDIEQAYPHNQGFDVAFFPLHQQVQLSLMTREAMSANNMLGYDLSGQSNQFNMDKRFRPYGLVTGVEGKAGGKAREVDLKPGEEWTQAHYERMNERYQTQALEQLERLAAKDEPFFLQYWPLYPLNFVHPDQAISRNGGFHADKLQLLDGWIGELLAKLDETGKADNTIVMYSTDNGAEAFLWPDGGNTPFRNEKNSNWDGGYRVPTLIRWPGVIKPGSIFNDVFSHEDMLPTFLAAVGEADIKEKLMKGHQAIGRDYKVHLDGYNLMPYLKGEVEEAPRKEFFYWSDDGNLTGLRYGRWKMVFMEQRAHGFEVWQEPLVTLRVPKLIDMRGDPFERADHEAESYNVWRFERAFLILPAVDYVAQHLATYKEFPPRQAPGSFNLDQVLETLQSNPTSN